MIDFLKKLGPTHEPVVYLFLLLVAYQLFGQKQPIPEYWIQYLSELFLTVGGRQLVKPLAKSPRDNDNA